ncbi:MAG TPA: DUF72 domain-containing protein [Thermoanaerobaculia bacterium]|nr:DUF72 domain-containing protein [Thermoanaerobaculia bacterium]
MRVRVGPAGWSYKDWTGPVYPSPKSSKFDELAFLAGLFDTIEVNSSFYRIPPASHSKSWLKRSAHNEDFLFTAKLFKGFTHEKKAFDEGDVNAFRAFLDPLYEAQKLGALLIQFPWSFKEGGGDAIPFLHDLFASFAPYPKVLEVRHGSFQNNDFLHFLEDEGVGFVNIDQPIFGDSVRPSDAVTAPRSYVRFHGRNYGKWFAHEESWERYDYLYPPSELKPWVKRVENMSEKSEVFVIMNNHFRGQAVVNSIEVMQSLGKTVEIPPQLAAAYPGRMKGA